MSDEAERTCPLCAEEMDLTDQHLKPCQCGYEICVWCWHHIIDMAEKDETEGRCPACRTPYDKEKIVGMAFNCERMAEINSERRSKPPKSKPKTSEGRNHLSSVRVIQRNLVYIVGIPANLADEETLERREYFGQYGKVLKVSISRMTGGSQHLVNNTCSVYITYAKEEEAIRCIQTVNGFILEGKPIRASFGTTKYCHAWLRNMPCNNPDCLYLHDIGTQEDSFTKDEIIAGCTRSRIQQITGTSNHLQRRSGNVLPPSADEFCNSGTTTTSGKLMVKSTVHTSVIQIKNSPPNGSSARSSILPAAASWGTRVANGRASTISTGCFPGPAKLRTDSSNCSSAHPLMVPTTTSTSAIHTHEGNGPMVTEETGATYLNGKLPGPLESLRQLAVRGSRMIVPDTTPAECSLDTSTTATETSPTNNRSSCASLLEDRARGIPLSSQATSSFHDELDRRSYNSYLDDAAIDGNMQNLCSGLSSVNIDSQIDSERVKISKKRSSISDHISVRSLGNPLTDLRQHHAEHGIEHSLTSEPLSRSAIISEGASAQSPLSDWSSELLADDDRRYPFSEGSGQPTYLHYPSRSLEIPDHSTWYHDNPGVRSHMSRADPTTQGQKVDEASFLFSASHPLLSSRDLQIGEIFECSDMIHHSSAEKACGFLGRLDGDSYGGDETSDVDMGESSIISNILSLDLDGLDDSLTSPHNLAKLFLSDTDRNTGSLKQPIASKVQSSNQSRFSFARQEDFVNQASYLEPSCSNNGLLQKNCFDDYVHLDKFQNGFAVCSMEDSVSTLRDSHVLLPSNKVAVSRAQVLVPPGFSIPRRAAPPGFSSRERNDRGFGTTNSGIENFSLLRNQLQTALDKNSGNSSDVEFIDPAIVAVGKGKLPLEVNNPGFDFRTVFSSQHNMLESDLRVQQMLMQQSLSTHQNLRFTDRIGIDRFSPSTDAHNTPSSRLAEQHVQNSMLSPFPQMSFQHARNSYSSNSQWDGWGEVQTGGDMGMAEIARNERLVGFSRYFPAYEELKFHMPGSGDLYNRAFGL